MIKFNNPELQRVHDQYAPFIELHKAKLDAMNKDIKQLEESLRKSGLTSHVHLYISNIGDGTSGSLEWRNNRIIAKNPDRENPLIEMPLRLRILFFDYLSNFLIMCSKSVVKHESQ